MSRRAPPPPPRRWLPGGGIAAVGLLVLWGALVWHDLRAARADLVDARKLVLTAAGQPANLRTAEGRSKAQSTFNQALGKVGAADHRLSQSPALALTRLVPGLAAQRAGLFRLVSDSRTSIQDANQLLSTVDGLAGDLKFNGAVPLAKLAELEAAVRTAGTQLQPLVRSPNGLWGSLWRARRDF